MDHCRITWNSKPDDIEITMTHVVDKHIAVIGAARSGLAAARLLTEKGADVFVSDTGQIRPEIKNKLTVNNIAFEENHHSGRAKEVDLAVISPGVPDHADIIKYYRETGIPVYSEIEAASWFNKSPIIAVTGSNGKTTVTSWMAHTWHTAGRSCLLAGNIGLAFSDIIQKTEPGTTAILEISSFQLDHIHSFRPDVSVILNITPDHLDRYQNRFENYIQSKFRITKNQQADDIFIYNHEDPVLQRRAKELRNLPFHPRLLGYSDRRELQQGVFVRNNEIIFKLSNSEERLMNTEDIKLPGRHNLNNSLATALAARVSEIRNEAIRESLKTFEGVEHRLELVSIKEGVRFINDSKATNINAAWFALDSYNMPIVLILGGRDKGNDYTALKDQILEKVHTIIAIGEARKTIKEQIGNLAPDFMEADTLQEAVSLGKKKAKRGEIVLLSPACASFDMFENYEHRGNVFKKAVHDL